MKKNWFFGAGFLVLTLLTGAPEPADARVALVTLPRRDDVQVTIYNSADITLVRERRALTMKKGVNKLEFSWSGTLIDPTSVQFDARTQADKLEVIDISFPPEAPNALVWSLESEVDGEVVCEISYFTSGLTWSADYEALLDPQGEKMALNSFVKVTNSSGEEYEGAQVRLVVGTIHLVENIADLANRGGRPISAKAQNELRRYTMAAPKPMAMASRAKSGGYGEDAEGMLEMFFEPEAPPEIIREGLSEFFLYTVSGEHDIPDGWGVRWPNFVAKDVPVENFYRQEEGRYPQPRRFLKLYNKKEANLGAEPLPDGMIRVFRRSETGNRVFLGQSLSKYVPVGEKWEIDLGEDPEVVVKDTKKRFAVENVEFNEDGHVSGWDIVEDWKIELLNSRSKPATLQIERNFAGDFTLSPNAEKEKYDHDTVRFKRTLSGESAEAIEYQVTTRKGTRAKR